MAPIPALIRPIIQNSFFHYFYDRTLGLDVVFCSDRRTGNSALIIQIRFNGNFSPLPILTKKIKHDKIA